jgi:heme exporter protein B
MLPILLYPLLVPIVIGVVRMTGQILAGEPLSGMMNWIGLTASFDIIYIGVSIMTIDHILEE